MFRSAKTEPTLSLSLSSNATFINQQSSHVSRSYRRKRKQTERWKECQVAGQRKTSYKPLILTPSGRNGENQLLSSLALIKTTTCCCNLAFIFPVVHRFWSDTLPFRLVNVWQGKKTSQFRKLLLAIFQTHATA